MTAIEVRGLGKVYPRGVVALDQVSFSVASGGIVGILGPNGAGKSTLLRLLMTLTLPTKGDAEVLGMNVVTQPTAVRRAVGYVPQSSSFDEFETPTANLLFQARLYHVPAAEREPRVAKLIDMFGLSDVADRRIKQLSGGTRRRVDLAAALVHEPSLLIMDEPTTGLDPSARREMWDSVRRLVETTGMTILFTTHYLDEADQHSDRVIIIDRGNIAAEGTADDLKSSFGGDRVSVRLATPPDPEVVQRIVARLNGIADPTVTDTTLHFASSEARSDVWRMLDAINHEGLTIASTEISRPSLDDVYLRATGRTFTAAEQAKVPPPRTFSRWGARA